MLDSKLSQAEGSALVEIKRVLRGVIYGSVERDFVGEASKTLEFFINGISIGTTTIEPSDFEGDEPHEFKFLILPSFIFEAPLSIRMREVGADTEIGSPLVFQEVVDANAAILVADGVVAAVERGSVKGSLRDINPDALPIAVGVYCRGVPIARTVVGSKAVLSASGSLISSLPFSVGLPPSVLDGASTSISVRIEGSSQEFVGSPLILRLDAGDGLHDRLIHLEQKSQELEAEVALLRSSIVGDIAEQFYRFIVPRVDAFLTVQREGLEGQMTALWRDLGGESPAPIARRKLPESVSISLADNFTGYRWSDLIATAPGNRWFTRSAFVATEIADKNDILVVVKGAHAVSSAALASLALAVNGRPIEVASTASAAGWQAIAVVPRAAIAGHGSLGLQFETEIAEPHPLAPPLMGPVSLSVGSVDLLPLKTKAAEYPISASPEVFPIGWYTMEQSASGQRFRWMGADGLAVLNGLEPGAPIRIEISGPMVLDGVLSNVTAELDGVSAEAVRVETRGSGWALEFEFPARQKGACPAALLRIRAPAKQPSPADMRFLSLAVSEILVDQAPKSALSPPEESPLLDERSESGVEAASKIPETAAASGEE